MNRLFAIPVLLLSMLIGSPAFSADFQKALYAYKSGNYKYALRKFRGLAEQGDVRSQYNLGVMYENGQGTQKNYAHGYMWFDIAASHGNKTAKEDLDRITKFMSKLQLDAAKKLVSARPAG